MAESSARIGIYADDKASTTVKSVQGLMQGLAATAKTSILTGVGLAGGVAAFNVLKNAAGAAVDYLGDAIAAASKMNESVAKVNVVFGKSSDEVLAWGKTMASSFGISNQAALEAAGTYGNLFIAFGMGQDEATKMSMTLVELAADLASFNNTSVTDALDALRSGLSGETEPLKRYGIAISDARMRTELMSQGVKDLGATLTPLQKTTAAYALIMKDSALAQGDSARSAGNLAMQQKFLEAEMADLSVEIGQKLLPASLEITKALLALARVAKDNLEPAINGVGFVVGLVAKGLQTIGAPLIIAKGLFDELTATAYDATAGLQTMPAGMRSAMEGTVAALESGEPEIAAAANQAIVEPMTDAMLAARAKAYTESRAIPGEVSRALIDGMEDVKSGLEALKTLMSESLSDVKKIAYYEGVLGSKALASGLLDERADVRAAALAVQADAVYQLQLLKSGAADAAASGGLTFAAYLRLQGTAAGNAATSVRLLAAKNLSLTAEFAAGGRAVAASWVEGLRATLYANLWRIDAPLSRYAGKMIGLSPPKEGPLKDIDKGAFRIAQSWTTSFAKGIGPLNLPALKMPNIQMPGIGRSEGGGGISGGGRGMGDVHIHIEGPVYGDGPFLDDLANKITQRLRYAPGT